MSTEAINWALGLTVGNPTQKFVLVMLANWADQDWSCKPGIPKIAARTEFTGRAVQKAIVALRENGYIRVMVRTGETVSPRTRAGCEAHQSNRYQLLYSGDATPLPENEDWAYVIGRDGVPVSTSADAQPVDNPREVVNDVQGGGERRSGGVVNDVQGGGEPGSPLDTKGVPTGYTSSTPAAEFSTAEAQALAAGVLDAVLEPVPEGRRPGGRALAAMTADVAALVAGGWSVRRLTGELRRGGSLADASVRSVGAVLRTRLRDIPPSPPAKAPRKAAGWPSWCGHTSCHPDTRLRYDGASGKTHRCGECHPGARR